MKVKFFPLVALVSVGSFFALLISCGEGDDPGPIVKTPVPAATNLTIDDVNNSGNASDISVSFTTPADETNIKEYWVVVVKTALISTLTLDQAIALPSTNYQVVAKSGNAQSLFLSSGLSDFQGLLIANDNEYTIFVVSVSTDDESTTDAISLPSNSVLMDTPAVDELIIDDTKNSGNASDILVEFSISSKEDDITEYRVVVIKSADANSFTLAQAKALTAGNYQAVPKNGNDQSLFLSSSLNDVEGNAIIDGEEYTVIVISANDTELTADLISSPSNSVLMGNFTIRVSYMGNMGVVISDYEGHQVIIDALHQNTSGWYRAPSASLNSLITAGAPWGNSDITMVTHNHTDHYTFANSNNFLNANTDAIYIGPVGTRGGINNVRNQVSQINPARFTSETVNHNGIEVEVLHLRHFDQFGNDFSSVDNYAFIVNMGGKKVMHVGDAFYNAANYEPFDLANKGIDVLVIPTFGNLYSTANRDLVMNLINPVNIIAAHLQTSTTISDVQALYPNATIFTEGGAFKKY